MDGRMPEEAFPGVAEASWPALETFFFGSYPPLPGCHVKDPAISHRRPSLPPPLLVHLALLVQNPPLPPIGSVVRHTGSGESSARHKDGESVRGPCW